MVAVSTPNQPRVRTQPSRDHFRRNDGGDEAGADHAERDARHDVDEIHAAFARGGYCDHAASSPDHEAEHGDRAPQRDVDDKGGGHSLSPFGYILT